MARAIRRLAATFVVAGTVFFATGAHAGYWTQMFAFGDSLSDSGNAAALTELSASPPVSFFPPSGLSPIPGDTRGVPYNFRFSNGPVAAEYLALRLGLPPSSPAWPSGSATNPNYAVGGAMTGTRTLGAAPEGGNYNWIVDSPIGLQGGFPNVRDTGLDSQVALFTSRVGTAAVTFDPTRTLFTVWGGPNDVFLGLDLAAAGDTIDFNALLISSAINIANRIGQLAAFGGMHFFVINMPDLGLTPLAIATGTEADLSALAVGFNTALAAALTPLKGAGLDIIEFDAFSEFQMLIANAGALGFTNTTEPCFDTSDPTNSLPRVLNGCQGYLYFDSVHPTTAAHSIIAASFAAAIPEPGMLALLAAAMLANASVRRFRKRVRA